MDLYLTNILCDACMEFCISESYIYIYMIYLPICLFIRRVLPRDTWRSGVRSAMRAASQLPGRGPTVVDIAHVPAR